MNLRAFAVLSTQDMEFTKRITEYCPTAPQEVKSDGRHEVDPATAFRMPLATPTVFLDGLRNKGLITSEVTEIKVLRPGLCKQINFPQPVKSPWQ